MDLTALSRGIRGRGLLAGGLFLCLASTAPSGAVAALRVHFGTLHAYTGLSDGLASVRAKDAYRIAREQGEMDFLSITDHSEMLSTAEMQELRSAAELASDGHFVGLAGQTAGSGQTNSTSIHNLPLPIPAAIGDRPDLVYGDLLPRYVASHPEEPIVAGFNHPRNLATDYGLASEFKEDWNAFVATYDPFVQLIAVGIGPTDSGQPTYVPDTDDRFLHRDINVAAWLQYLARGMHVAPQIDHGTHSATFGFRADGRTAVWVDGEFTQLSLMEALAQRHCYATEDRNLNVIAFVGDHHLPGDIVRGTPGDTIPVTLHINDPDETEVTYEIEVWRGRTGSGRVAKPLDQTYRLDRNGGIRVDLVETPGHYYVIHLVQRSKDSPCGSADDVWLPPIWMEAEPFTDFVVDAWAYVCRRGGHTYHTPSCRAMVGLDRSRMEFHASAPPGLQPHVECVPQR